MANTGIAPPDFTTNVGRVRVLVGDTDAQNISDGEGEYAFYSDDELEALLSIYNDNVRRTAIVVLTNVGMSRALLLGKWTSDDLSVDGPAILAALEKTIRRLSDELDAEAAAADEYFDIAPTGTDHDYLPHAEGAAFSYQNRNPLNLLGW